MREAKHLHRACVRVGLICGHCTEILCSLLFMRTRTKINVTANTLQFGHMTVHIHAAGASEGLNLKTLANNEEIVTRIKTLGAQSA